MRQQLTDQSLLREEAIPQTPVECLDMTFEDDEARRAYFLDKLREGLEELHTKHQRRAVYHCRGCRGAYAEHWKMAYGG